MAAKVTGVATTGPIWPRARTAAQRRFISSCEKRLGMGEIVVEPCPPVCEVGRCSLAGLHPVSSPAATVAPIPATAPRINSRREKRKSRGWIFSIGPPIVRKLMSRFRAFATTGGSVVIIPAIPLWGIAETVVYGRGVE